jgi:hypothetical protein
MVPFQNAVGRVLDHPEVRLVACEFQSGVGGLNPLWLEGFLGRKRISWPKSEPQKKPHNN